MREHRASTAPVVVLVALATLAAGAAQAAPKVSSGNGWSGATAISPVSQPDPTRGTQWNDVAVNASGLAIAAWDQYTYNNGGGATIGVAVQSGGRWAAPLTVSGTTGFSMSPRVAVGSDGTMAVSWTYQDPASGPAPQQKTQVAVRPAGSSAWTTTTLATGPMGGAAVTAFVPVAVDASGNVTAAWSLWDGAHNVVQAATKPAGQPWSAPVNVAPGVNGLSPSLAVNARGDAAVVFSVTPYAGYYMPSFAQYAFRSLPNGAWSSPVTISETIPASVGYVSNPLVGLDQNGLATVVYLGYGLEATRQLSAGNWTPPRAVITAPNAVSSFTCFDLGLDQNGNSVIAASVFDATVGVDRASVWVARGSSAGVWSPALRITDPTVPIDAYAARVAVSPDGGLAFVGWIDHYHGTVQVSKLVGTIWGTANTIGRGTAFSSFQEMLGLDAASGALARAVWKNAKSGTQTMAASYGKSGAAASAAGLAAPAPIETAGQASADAAVARLGTLWPNPARQQVSIDFDLPRPAVVHLAVFNVTGRMVRVLKEGATDAGRHTVVWDGRDATGRPLPSGHYFLRLSRGSEPADTRRITLLR